MNRSMVGSWSLQLVQNKNLKANPMFRNTWVNYLGASFRLFKSLQRGKLGQKSFFFDITFNSLPMLIEHFTEHLKGKC